MEHLFPKLSKESYTESGEAIYGGSIGMNRVYDTLVKTVSKTEAHAFRIICINALTVIRNNYDENIKELKKKTQIDLTTLITYLSVYLRNTKEDDRKVTILLVYPNYDKLPKEVVRPPSTQLKRILDSYIKEEKTIVSGLNHVLTNDVLQLYTLKAGNRFVYPHQIVKDILVRQIDLEKRGEAIIPYRLGEPIHVLSHLALDWHLSEYFKNVNLIESYTGLILPSNMFGSKLIKDKNLKIPFNSIIHKTFGDATLIKALALRTKRKNLLNSAKRWSMMTTDKINSLISKELDIPLTKLNSNKFI